MKNLYRVIAPLVEVKTSFDAKVTQTGLPLAIRIIEALLKPLSQSERSVKTIRESVPEWQNAFSDNKDNESLEMTVTEVTDSFMATLEFTNGRGKAKRMVNLATVIGQLDFGH
jgi:hydrogenase maturation factor